MLVVRPAAVADIPALASLAAVATLGVHTLPRTPRTITRAVERSLESFAAEVDVPGEESYLFVLESGADGALLGCAAISAAAGANGTYFAFRNDVMQQVSRDLHISHSVHALTLCSALTGYSQLSGFFVRGPGRGSREAALLSRARLLFAALAPQRFNARFFAALAGVTDASGASPFWEALGRKFFQMDFLEAERLIEGARNRTLIIELMPHYPVYAPILPGPAQAAMGQVHAEGELPFQLLTEEGFEPDEFIDIFDGGPILQAHKHALRSFNASFLRPVTDRPPPADAEPPVAYLLAAARPDDFRAILFESPPLEYAAAAWLPPQLRASLRLTVGEAVLCVRL